MSHPLRAPRVLFVWCLLTAVATPLPVDADQSPVVRRIVVLATQGLPESREQHFRQALQELGYVEGRNINVSWLGGAETPEDMRSLAAEMTVSSADLIVTLGSTATRAALDTTTKPVVMLVGDPVGAGFAEGLARPGGRATGVSIQTTDLNRKRLELVHQLTPGARRIAYLVNNTNPMRVVDLAEMQNGARALGLRLSTISAQSDAEIDAALKTLRQPGVDAVVVSANPIWLANRAKAARAIREARLPAVFPYKEYHEVGVLMSYSPDHEQALRRLATYVDRVLKGAKPADLPIEQISTYKLIVDLRVAREMGINVPQDMLIRADEVIR